MCLRVSFCEIRSYLSTRDTKIQVLFKAKATKLMFSGIEQLEDSDPRRQQDRQLHVQESSRGFGRPLHRAHHRLAGRLLRSTVRGPGKKRHLTLVLRLLHYDNYYYYYYYGCAP